MKVIKLLFILLFCPSIILGQNLIPNGSFEDTLRRTGTIYQPTNWVSATTAGWNYFTPYNSPSNPYWASPQNLIGHQIPKSGQAYIGILMFDLSTSVPHISREYAHVKLNKTLEQDSTYCLQLYVSLADSCLFASRNHLGVYFSNQLINVNTFDSLPLLPQIIVSPNNYIVEKGNWKEFNFQYTANGGENHITVGNFKGVGRIDTVGVQGGKTWEIVYKTTYYYIDDIWLSHCDSLPDTTIGIVERDLGKQLDLYPNPSKNFLNIELQDKTIQVYEIQVLNLIGQKQRIEAIEMRQHKMVLEIANLKPGVYLLQIISGKGVLVKKFVKD